MNKFLAAIFAFVGLAGLTLISSATTVRQPSAAPRAIPTITPPPGIDCGGYDVVKVWTFDTSVEDWQPQYNNGTATWLGQKNFGIWPFWTKAFGVLAAGSDSYAISNFIYLEPAQYRLVIRGAKDGFPWGSTVGFRYGLGVDHSQFGQATLSDSWGSIDTSGAINVQSPDTYGIFIASEGGIETSFYLDYVCLVMDTAGAATPTPFIFPGATKTPTPVGTLTPIPTQATALPTPTIVCEFATPTPGDAMPNATPAYTDTSRLWSRLTTSFGSVTKIGIVSLANVDHTPNSHIGSMKVGYSDNSSSTVANAALFSSDNTYSMTAPFYASIWAKADNVPMNTTASVVLWGKPFTSATYIELGRATVGAQYWYHIEVTVNTDIEILAIRANRTDNPGSGGIYVDDVYFYGDSSLRPLCNGYPSGVFGNNTMPGGTFYTVWWPTDKPCPQPLTTSNNFFGPILEGFQLQSYSIFRDAHLHEAETFLIWARASLDLVIGIFLYVSIFFNWFWTMVFVGIVCAAAVPYYILLGAKTVKIVNPIN